MLEEESQPAPTGNIENQELLEDIISTSDPPSERDKVLGKRVRDIYTSFCSTAENNPNSLVRGKTLLQHKSRIDAGLRELRELHKKGLVSEPRVDPFKDEDAAIGPHLERNREIANILEKFELDLFVERSDANPESLLMKTQSIIDLLLTQYSTPYHEVDRMNLSRIRPASTAAVRCLFGHDPEMAMDLVVQFLEKRNAVYQQDTISENIVETVVKIASIPLGKIGKHDTEPEEMHRDESSAAMMVLAYLYLESEHNISYGHDRERAWLFSIVDNQIEKYAKKLAVPAGWETVDAKAMLKAKLLETALQFVDQAEDSRFPSDFLDDMRRKNGRNQKIHQDYLSRLPDPDTAFKPVWRMLMETGALHSGADGAQPRLGNQTGSLPPPRSEE